MRVLALFVASCLVSLAGGCGEIAPDAEVEGVLRFRGTALDRCAITFLPEGGSRREHATGFTGAGGEYRLVHRNRRPGVWSGRYRVTIQDTSVSTGVRRLDHGTADVAAASLPAPPIRRSRVPAVYSQAATTPLVLEITPGNQRIDFELP